MLLLCTLIVPSAPKVLIVAQTFERGGYTALMAAQLAAIGVRHLIVRDNGSKDYDRAQLEKWFPTAEAIFIESPNTFAQILVQLSIFAISSFGSINFPFVCHDESFSQI